MSQYEQKNWKKICEEKDAEIQRLNEALETILVYLEMCENDMKSITELNDDLFKGLCSPRFIALETKKLSNNLYGFYTHTHRLIN